ncbi:hypothetical protein BJ508DRAFT_322332 [Ascobolus immersus RN42]|uniref:Uncharacterized protein n=1 Tax=Ascobolus immersus RN42 TaxID=1160509 RepID=A0A3N4IIQ8_ASCIM|nr:hypothetical protein BJ508DRAFT_322332 [Ascobolus immersus RN42]
MTTPGSSDRTPLVSIPEMESESAAATPQLRPEMMQSAASSNASSEDHDTNHHQFVTTRKPKRESARRSSLFFKSGKDDTPTSWYCSSFELPEHEKTRITKDDAHQLLSTFIGESNEDLQHQLDDYAEQCSAFAASTGFDPMAAAIDHKFEEIRFAAAQALAAHDEALAQHVADQEY